MNVPLIDVLCVGNTVVDALAFTDEKFLVQYAIPKGSMSLIDEDRAEAICAGMGPMIEVSGGSAAAPDLIVGEEARVDHLKIALTRFDPEGAFLVLMFGGPLVDNPEMSAV